MTDESRVSTLLKSAMPPIAAVEPSRDLWPLVTHRPQRPAVWSPIDLGLAAATALAVVLVPHAWLLVAYHF